MSTAALPTSIAAGIQELRESCSSTRPRNCEIPETGDVLSFSLLAAAGSAAPVAAAISDLHLPVWLTLAPRRVPLSAGGDLGRGDALVKDRLDYVLVLVRYVPNDDLDGQDGRRAGDLLDRDFSPAAPNRTWVMDFTNVRTWAAFVDVAFILDIFAQRIVTWNVASSKDVELVDVPRRMALWQRDREGRPIVPGELIGHADAGSQYSSIAFTDHLADAGIRPSIGTIADAYDNALMECVMGLYKTQCVRTMVFHAGPLRTIGDVEFATAGWYNNRRLDGTRGMMTPVEFEQAHYATLNREPHPVWGRRRTWGASHRENPPAHKHPGPLRSLQRPPRRPESRAHILAAVSPRTGPRPAGSQRKQRSATPPSPRRQESWRGR